MYDPRSSPGGSAGIVLILVKVTPRGCGGGAGWNMFIVTARCAV